MNKEEIEKILITNGWKKTLSCPSNLLDYQRSNPYNRIILFPLDIKEITLEQLKYLMNTPIEIRKPFRFIDATAILR